MDSSSSEPFRKFDYISFKRRYEDAFNIAPELSADEIYRTLRDNNFDRERTYKSLRQRPTPVFWIPESALGTSSRSPSPQKPPSSGRVKPSHTTKAPHCVENSDEDPASSFSLPRRRSRSKSAQTHRYAKEFNSYPEVAHLLEDTSGPEDPTSEEDIRGPKRRRSTVVNPTTPNFRQKLSLSARRGSNQGTTPKSSIYTPAKKALGYRSKNTPVTPSKPSHPVDNLDADDDDPEFPPLRAFLAKDSPPVAPTKQRLPNRKSKATATTHSTSTSTSQRAEDSDSDDNPPSFEVAIKQELGEKVFCDFDSLNSRPQFEVNHEGVYVELDEDEDQDEAGKTSSGDYFYISSDSEGESSETNCIIGERPEPKSARKLKKAGNLDEDVLKHRIETKATPWIRRLAGALFNRALGAAEVSALDQADHNALIDMTRTASETASDLKKMIHASTNRHREYELLGSPCWEDLENNTKGYSALELDDVIYKVGDCCVMHAGEEIVGPKHKRGKSTTKQRTQGTTEPWFARIISIYEDEHGSACVHVQWFEHGSSTILGETAGPRELFLLDLCDDNLIDCISGKIKVDWLSEVGTFGSEVETKYKGKRYFYRFIYDSRKENFTHAPCPTEVFSAAGGGHTWRCCQKKKEQERLHGPAIPGRISSDGTATTFEQEGTLYFLEDFVYVTDPFGGPYHVGQILALETTKSEKGVSIEAKLSWYHRYDDRFKSWWKENKHGENHKTRDSKRLFLSAMEFRTDVSRIEGKCRVRHFDDIEDLNAYKDAHDSFWVKDKSDGTRRNSQENLVELKAFEMRYPQRSEQDLIMKQTMLGQYHATIKPLSALELFVGGGGLSIGLHQSGTIDTKWAIEFAPAAADTFKKNKPTAKVYNEDGSSCLQRAIQEDQGIDTSHVRDVRGNPTRRMPKRGEVEFVCGGFPCPGYSGINQQPKSDDVKNTLITMTLSYVDFYRPKYVLLENVSGLLRHRLGGKQAGPNSVTGGIEKGTLKFILRALTSLGYACQYTLLQSGEFGVPQSRQRVIFWASAPGFDLPNYPQARTQFAGQCPNSWHRTRTGAAHREINVGDAVTDLPRYEWVNPHNALRQSREERLDRAERSKSIKQIKIREGDKYVGSDLQPYATPPLSEYQRVLRKGVSDNSLRNHVNHAFFDKAMKRDNGFWTSVMTEQVCNIKMRPGADHRTMDLELRPRFLYAHDSAADRNKYYPGRYGRLDLSKPFQTCLTDINPSGKNGNTIHPTQHRVISIREQARAQGFPDWFTWDLEKITPKLALRMIGNAVPVPLAKALGDELLETRFKAWMKTSGQNTKDSPTKISTPTKQLSSVPGTPGTPVSQLASLTLKWKPSSLGKKLLAAKGKGVRDAIPLSDDEGAGDDEFFDVDP